MPDNRIFPSITPGRDRSGDFQTLDQSLRQIQTTVDTGECPFCEEYDGDHVGRHASKAHPDKWQAYTDARED